MKTKTCIKCKEKKSIKEFGRNKSSKDGLNYYCKQCANKYSKEYRIKNLNKLRRRARIYSRRNNREIREWLDTVKLGIGCQVCGYNKCVKALEFHHKNPREKDICISKLITLRYSKEKILEEISKCILLCSNHHRELYEELYKLKADREDKNWKNIKSIKEEYNEAIIKLRCLKLLHK